MTKLKIRMDRLEAQRPDASSDVTHVIIRSMIRPGVDEPVAAFAYVLGSLGQIHMEEGETYSDFEERIARHSEEKRNDKEA